MPKLCSLAALVVLVIGCNRDDLTNAEPTLNQRIDFVLTRNMPDLAVPIRHEVLGDRARDRTAGGLWPSDHAGVVQSFQVSPRVP